MRMWLAVVGGGRTGWGGKRLQRRMGLDEVGYSSLPPLTTANHILPCHTFLPHSQPCPTLPYHSPPRSRLASSAILPCPTSSYPSLPHPTPAYTVSYCRPNLVLHGILLRAYPASTQQPSPRLAPLAGRLH